MKELSEKYKVNPADFCRDVPMPANRENRKFDDALEKIYADRAYIKRFTELSGEQQEYIKALADSLKEKFNTVGELRIALVKNHEILDVNDPDTKYDLFILGRIYK